MKIILIILLNITVLAIHLYIKILPVKDKLYPRYKNYFKHFDALASRILNFIKRVVNPLKIGHGLVIDLSSFMLLIIILVLLNIISCSLL